MASDSGTVTVWSMEPGTPPPAVLTHWLAVLSRDEAARAERFRYDADRYAYIAAHALLRCLLEVEGGHAAASWRFETGEHGKPHIVGPSLPAGLEFSLSHTRSLVVCAAARGHALGIDAESLDRRAPGQSVMQAVLAPSELALVETAPEDERPQTFFKLWTLREAYVKATGLGIRFPREDFSFALDPLGIAFAGEGEPDGWQVFAWDENRHAVSLAVKRNRRFPVRVVRRILAPEELLSQL